MPAAIALEAFSGSFPANADLSAAIYKFVELNTSGKLAVATVQGQKVFGVLQRDDAAAADRGAAVQWGGIAKVYAGGTVDEGDFVISDSSGRAIASTDGGFVAGRAVSPGAVGEVISVLLATPGGGSFQASKGFIPLPLAQARELDTSDIINAAGNGGLLAKDSTPILESINGATDRKLWVKWASSNSDVIAWDFVVPPDLDDTQAVTLHALAKMAGATDTPVLTWTWFQGVGDSNAGGNTAALSATLAEVTRSIAAADVLAHPSAVTVSVAPGAHTTDACSLLAAWVEYTRK